MVSPSSQPSSSDRNEAHVYHGPLVEHASRAPNLADRPLAFVFDPPRVQTVALLLFQAAFGEQIHPVPTRFDLACATFPGLATAVLNDLLHGAPLMLLGCFMGGCPAEEEEDELVDVGKGVSRRDLGNAVDFEAFQLELEPSKCGCQ